MQRLNALFSFIENQFAAGSRYFDVKQLSRAMQKAKDGYFSPATDPAVLLSAEGCADFLDYTLAITEFPANDPSAVNEVFGRINSYGRQLSAQEKRQAGVISGFANLIREVAAEVRGDVSKESLDLSDMPAISVDTAGSETDYAIKAEDTFWCKQGSSGVPN